MADTRADHALFVRAARWALANGWRQEIYLHTELVHQETGRLVGWREHLNADRGYTHLQVTPVTAPRYGIPNSVTVTSVRQAVGVLVALDILPATVLADPDAGPFDGWTECPIAGCPSTGDADPEAQDEFEDADGWAHGVRHHHVIDHWMVRLADLHTSAKG